MPTTKLTPVQIVDSIEPLLPLWERLGFTTIVSVPDGDRLGFALLSAGSAELMLQTRRSLAKDLPAVAALSPSMVLYADVTSLDETLRALGPVELLVPRRTTFYGAHEVALRDASGQIVVFAEHVKEAAHA